ncbi:MAG: NADH-quinone oxidoreductase subunit M [Myxococcaceae bacterium]|nr:NADH-quinone oxidoreductase subunit M [Myxococcaceae bacterium]
MTETSNWLLNVVIFLPLLFAGLVAFLPSGERTLVRGTTFVGMLLSALASVWLYLDFVPNGPEFQFETRWHWIDALGISYHIGVDGLAVSLILLTGFLGPMVVLASWGTVQNRVKEFHLSLLVLQTAMLGALSSLDIILFYVFWEAMLIPMYLLIGVWGSEDRVMAAVKFFLYTLVGSFLMLVAILAIYFISQPNAGARSFDLATIYNALVGANRELSACLAAGGENCHLSPVAATLKTWGPYLFLAFALAFAIKVPMWPVHTWLPDAHVQAPMAGSIILAGVMLKMGTFGFWRFAFPLFPANGREFQILLAVLAVIGIVYGALMCLAQRDIKKLIAYSSVSHLGFCMLGMLAMSKEGATGSAYQMLNHGVSTGALFLLFGLLYDRGHTRLMADYGGVAKVMPVFAAFFLIITFSSIAVPGTNGFVGEFLVLLGTFKSDFLKYGFGVFAATAVILGAAYMLWMVQRVFFGEPSHREAHHLSDLNAREIVTALPFVVLVLVMGLMPQPFLERIEPASARFVARATLGSPHAPADAARLLRMEVADLPPAESAPKIAALPAAPTPVPAPSPAALQAVEIPPTVRPVETPVRRPIERRFPQLQRVQPSPSARQP